MGTRADFYVGRGEQAEWLGSIGWDGYPSHIPEDVLKAVTEDSYRTAVKAMLGSRNDSTLPDMGWPWPWEDSRTTDYAYAWESDQVYVSRFGRGWRDMSNLENMHVGEKTAVFPNMKSRQNVRWDEGSGLMVLTVK